MPVAVLFVVTMDVAAAMAVIVDSSFGRIHGQRWDACGCSGSAGPMQLTRQAGLATVVAGKEASPPGSHVASCCGHCQDHLGYSKITK